MSARTWIRNNVFSVVKRAVGPAEIRRYLAREQQRRLNVGCGGNRIPGWLNADLVGTIRDDPRLASRLLLLGDLPDEAMAWLYAHCAFTLHPTFAEEWSPAVADSLAAGKHCVASATAANAEAAQGLLDLLDPLDFMAWRREVGRLIGEPGHLAARERRIAGYCPPDWTAAGDRLIAEIDAGFADRARAGASGEDSNHSLHA